MGAPSDVELKSNIKVALSTQYKRTDKTLNTTNLNDNLNIRLGFILNNGAGKDKANLQWYSTRRLISTSETIDVDNDLVDNFGNSLNFDAINYMLVRNLETVSGRYLQVNFKSEQYYIHSGSLRVIFEPFGAGITAISQSGSAEEGNITVSSNADITYDIVLVGSHAESSSSSGV